MEAGYRGKYCIVTGGNAGIGLEIVRVLASLGAIVIIACRTVVKGQQAAQHIKANITPQPQIEVMNLDLMSFKSIHHFAQSYINKQIPLHFLFNNAGIESNLAPNELTEDGFEPVWQTNYLGHFLLTILLLEKMKTSSPARVINVSSAFHEFVPSKLDFEVAATTVKKSRYASSKLAQIMFSYEFQRKIGQEGKVQSIVVHPGGVATDIWKWIPLSDQSRKLITNLVLLSPIQAAYVVTKAGLFPVADGQTLYFAPFKQYFPKKQVWNDIIGQLTLRKPDLHVVQSSTSSYNKDIASSLWRQGQQDCKWISKL